MASIKLFNVSIDFPIYSLRNRSLKNLIIRSAPVGGKAYYDNGISTVKALSNISFELNDGDRLGLVGHNGSGKSTLLRVLNGVYMPKSGVINIEGQRASLLDISLGMDMEATGLENIYMRATLMGINKSVIDLNLDSIIEFSELGEFINFPIRTYSSGMQMRLAFSVSTIVRPEILLMDEWLSVGDDAFQIKAEARMRDVISGTNIIVIASHSRDLIKKLCNKVLVLDGGSCRYYGGIDKFDEYYQ